VLTGRSDISQNKIQLQGTAMKNQKDQLIEQTDEQANPYLCDPNSWEVVRDDDEIFHGQRSDKLLSSHTAKKRPAPQDVNNAAKSHTDALGE
jgi:hypothetical protein